MTNEVEMQKNTIVNKKFSDQELYRITWRWSLFLATIWNYEKMEAAGYLITMACIRKKNRRAKPSLM